MRSNLCQRESERTPQVKIICLAHPATWNDVVRDPTSLKQKMLSLRESAHCWVDLSKERGTRRGVYRIGGLERENHILVAIVAESEINQEYSSLEKILADDECLPENIKIPSPVPSASKALLFFDLIDGVCYLYASGMSPKAESVLGILGLLETDIGAPLKSARIFEWEESIVTTITEVARTQGFTPYKAQADLETVKVTAVGDLDNNEQWKKIEGAVELETWRTIAYARLKEGVPFVFGLTRRLNKVISMPEIDSRMNVEEILERVLEMRALVEKALGCDLRQYCFPEPVRTLSQFMR